MSDGGDDSKYEGQNDDERSCKTEGVKGEESSRKDSDMPSQGRPDRTSRVHVVGVIGGLEQQQHALDDGVFG